MEKGANLPSQMESSIFPSNILDELSIHLLNTGKAAVGQEWNFSNITSPFTRIYLIIDGEGYIMPNNKMYKLKPGYLYIIPSYVQCNYNCVEYLSQFYIHLINEFPTGLNIYDFFSIQTEVEAISIDTHLFQRLTEINTGLALEQSDPSSYEQKSWDPHGLSFQESSAYLESIGILKQIISRFLSSSIPDNKNLQSFSTFRKVFQYINANLHQEIRIEKLAEIACYSYDHFTRIFRRSTGMLPMHYINNKRIEKAQILLLTTAKSQVEISELSGFNNLPYYYRVFKKKTGTTPVNYRKLGGLI